MMKKYGSAADEVKPLLSYHEEIIVRLEGEVEDSPNLHAPTLSDDVHNETQTNRYQERRRCGLALLSLFCFVGVVVGLLSFNGDGAALNLTPQWLSFGDFRLPADSSVTTATAPWGAKRKKKKGKEGKHGDVTEKSGAPSPVELPNAAVLAVPVSTEELPFAMSFEEDTPTAIVPTGSTPTTESALTAEAAPTTESSPTTEVVPTSDSNVSAEQTETSESDSDKKKKKGKKGKKGKHEKHEKQDLDILGLSTESVETDSDIASEADETGTLADLIPPTTPVEAPTAAVPAESAPTTEQTDSAESQPVKKNKKGKKGKKGKKEDNE